MTGPSTRWYKVSFRGGPGFFSGKPAGGRTPVLAFIQKGAAAPGIGVSALFQSRAQPDPGGPGPPCCMNVGSGDAVPADFHEEKIGTFSGSPGAKLPAAFLLPFVATS